MDGLSLFDGAFKEAEGGGERSGDVKGVEGVQVAAESFLPHPHPLSRGLVTNRSRSVGVCLCSATLMFHHVPWGWVVVVGMLKWKLRFKFVSVVVFVVLVCIFVVVVVVVLMSQRKYIRLGTSCCSAFCFICFVSEVCACDICLPPPSSTPPPSLSPAFPLCVMRSVLWLAGPVSAFCD